MNPEKSTASTRAWQARNPERAKATHAAWRARPENAERVKKYSLSNYYRNIEQHKAYKQRYIEANRDRVTAAAKAYWAAHRELSRYHNAMRRASKRRATPVWADLDAVQEIYELAARVSEQSGVKFDVDHIVPLRSPLVCGLHWEGNLRIIPALQNQQKGNRYWPEMP